MHEKSDAQLLRDYAERGNESAFREIVERHADLIYSSALRQMISPDLARDAAQSVFTDLARKAASLATTLDGNASLLGWLYRSTRFAALMKLRDERRRHARERQVMEHFNPASETAPDWEFIGPVLDEAMADLGDEDREALLLRFFKNCDFRAIGTALGVSDDAAQKRVSRALEKLRSYLTRRNVTPTTVALSTALSANGVQAAPIGLRAIISSAAITGSAVSTAGLMAAGKTLIMTTTQKILVTSVLAVAVGTSVYELAQNSRLRNDLQRVEGKLNPLAQQIEQLRRERDEMQMKFLSAQEDAEQWKKQIAELPKLRGDVARLRESERELAQLKAGENGSPVQAEMKSWLARVDQLKKRMEEAPDQRIPELQFVTEQDWLNVARGRLETEKDFRKALSQLRAVGENKFVHMLQPAWTKYLEANQGKSPTDVAHLQPYFEPPVDEAMLRRYEIVSADKIPNMKLGSDWLITQKAPVDEEYDGRFTVAPSGWGSSGEGAWKKRNSEEDSSHKILSSAKKAYKAAYGVSEPSDFSRLRPFVNTPEEQAALEKVITEIAAREKSER